MWGPWTGSESMETDLAAMPNYDLIREGFAYTFNVLRETLRLHSIVPTVTRAPAEDDEVNGYFIPKGSKVVINIWGVHHDPELWPGGDVNSFRPERFNEDFNQWAFLAFINGPRNCLGQHLALMEGRIILGLLVR